MANVMLYFVFISLVKINYEIAHPCEFLLFKRADCKEIISKKLTNNGAHSIEVQSKSLILYFCCWFKTKDAAQRRRLPKIDAMLVSPDTVTKGGGQHGFRFLICAFVSEL